jgi:3-hydroxymyristoyl/3-hydroxydecanoyl-(acyl carrier protein) dehydratase
MDLEKILRRGRRHRLFEPSESSANLHLGRDAIKQMIPHREPFLLLDEIVSVDLQEVAMLGRRRIDPTDPILRGHFPEEPIYPGALLLEMVGQLSLCLNHFYTHQRTFLLPEDRPRPIRLLKLHHATFQAEVRPDDVIDLIVKKVDGDDFTITCAGQVCKGDTICTVTAMEVYLVEEGERS